MTGFGGEGPRPQGLDGKEFPDFAAMVTEQRRHASMIDVTPMAQSAVEYVELRQAQDECDQFTRLASAAQGEFTECFMTAASPGIIATTMMNAHYDTHADYLDALAEGMRHEYELIHSKGLLLQLDCPDLAMERTRFFQDLSLPEFQEKVALHVDAINRALVNIPPDRVRLHVCWGNTNGPHIHDVPLADHLTFAL